MSVYTCGFPLEQVRFILFMIMYAAVVEPKDSSL
jgi:hypothetical protein